MEWVQKNANEGRILNATGKGIEKAKLRNRNRSEHDDG
jgi:hypothetical protein